MLNELQMLARVVRCLERWEENARGRNSISQEEYFRQLDPWFRHVSDSILVMGYDAPLMQRKITQTLLEAAVGKRLVHVRAILPEMEDENVLDRLAASSNLVSVTRTEANLDHGYLVFDDWQLATWDSRKSTPYPPEKDAGVYFRGIEADWGSCVFPIKQFNEVESSLRHSNVGQIQNT